MNYLLDVAVHIARTLPYRDLFEIFFFAAVIYYVQLWLRRDNQRNLLLGFYGYCALFFISFYADLPVLRFVLFVFAPSVGMLFIILHQETLQKNFITLRKPTVLPQGKTDWVDELVMCCLTALNRHKDIIVVLERNDLLKNLIHAPYFIYAELKKDVFDILLEKQMPGNDQLLWINQQGKIVSINSSWKTQIDEEWVSEDVEHLHLWKQQALHMTSKTDTLVLKVNPLTRSFDVIVHASIIEHLTAEQLTTYLKKQLIGSSREHGISALAQPTPHRKIL